MLIKLVTYPDNPDDYKRKRGFSLGTRVMRNGSLNRDAEGDRL